MPSLSDFNAITRQNEPLAPYTWLKIGGPAQYLMEPRSVDELRSLWKVCRELEVPVRILGGGSNILVRDEGVSGVVIRLQGEAFSRVEVEGNTIQAMAGALLSTVISTAVKHGLSGLDALAGIPGTIGGAVRGNAGGRSGEIGRYVTSVTIIDDEGELIERSADELSFAYRTSNLKGSLIVEAKLSFETEDPDAIAQRMRTIWIKKRESQPYHFQSAGCIFRNPRGMHAGELIDRSGLKGTRIGQAEVSDRHANFIVAHPNCSSQDVLRLIELIRSRVSSEHGVDLELEIEIW